MEKLSDIGLIGIAVMGENLALNMASKGFSVVVSSRKQETIDTFLNGRAKAFPITGTTDVSLLVSKLKKPRKVMLMIKAGKPVDDVIEQLIPLLEKGDVIIDGGNSLYTDTTRRTLYLKEKGLLFVGTGVSGGEEGALIGPSIMPGGNKAAWPIVKPILQNIAAKVADGGICCDWVGEDGAGHFVKMVHNGIEYGDIQLINETYHIMRNMLNMTNDHMASTFSRWNKSDLDSYLIEITADILSYKDTDGTYMIDKILDTAGQKGTGKWTVNASLDTGVPLTLIAESVFSRFLSAQKDERVVASKLYPKTKVPFTENKEEFIKDLEKALYGAKIISYTQGYALMKAAAKDYSWNLNYGGIAGGAAVVGCSVQMVGFAVMSRKDNNVGTVISVFIGTSMLQFKNILKKPIIWLPTIIVSAILGPFATLLLKVESTPSGAGMGTSGFVGQFGTLEAMGHTVSAYLAIFLLQILVPLILVFGLDLLFRKKGWIQPGDLKI